MTSVWYDDSAKYNFNEKYRGLAVIIVNKNFRHMAKRRGSHNDLKMMKLLFEALDFKVKCYKDLTARQMEETLDKARKSPLNKDSDCFACVISTHGQELEVKKTKGQPASVQLWKHFLYGCDDGLIPVNQLTEMFQESKCPDLAGKPKLFFIQACRSRVRGCRYDYGSLLSVSKGTGTDKRPAPGGRDQQDNPAGSPEPDLGKGDNSVESIAEPELGEYEDIYASCDDGMPGNMWEEPTETDDDDDDDEDEESIQDEEDVKGGNDENPPPPLQYETTPVVCHNDFLIMYPVGSGKLSFRNSATGSWMLYYMYHQLKVLLKMEQNFLSYLTSVCGRMAREYEYNPDPIPKTVTPNDVPHLPFKMAAKVVHKLTGDILFIPKEKKTKMAMLIDKFIQCFAS